MLLSQWHSDTFAATTLAIDLGAPCEKAIVMLPALTTDTYVTVGLSYDGTTYLTQEVTSNGNELDVVINSARCQVIDTCGCQYIQLTAPATAQTCTVYTRGIRT